MLVFIDESGDAGFKIGSSECLVISLVIFDDYSEADKTRDIIKTALQKTRQKPEFKFSRCSNENRDIFFQAVHGCKFRIRYICLRKKIMRSEYLRGNPTNFYNYALKMLIQHASLANAKVRIDGNGKKELNKALKTYLRLHSRPETIRTLRFVDSRREELIQLADMVASALARPHNAPGKSDASRWEQTIRSKIDKGGEWIFK